jgi:hypothetical protein
LEEETLESLETHQNNKTADESMLNDEFLQEAIREHALFLGMDPDVDQDYMWIAEEALKAPLPEGWQQGLAEDGTPYYFNNTTDGPSLWVHPLDEKYREKFLKAKALALENIRNPPPSLRGTIQIGNGRALHDWSTNDVDRWLLQWGANDAVRRRFAEIEIDGELLTLLERSDMEGEMGLLELTSARMVERLLEEINILKRTHGIQTIDVDVEGDNDSSPEQLSPKSLALRNKIAKANQNSMDQIKKQLGELYGKQ